jgi:hypothetical protein
MKCVTIFHQSKATALCTEGSRYQGIAEAPDRSIQGLQDIILNY